MKKMFVWGLLAAALIGGLGSCVNAPDFGAVQDREWNLIEVHIGDDIIPLDHSRLRNEGFGDVFTIHFGAELISGRGAPNRYSSPYALGAEQTISVQPIAATLMAPLREPAELTERDFFILVRNIHRWNLSGGNLELFTTAKDGEDAVLIFIPAS
jgi:heat shock protein HslJ